jgi:hypothetical protein
VSATHNPTSQADRSSGLATGRRCLLNASDTVEERERDERPDRDDFIFTWIVILWLLILAAGFGIRSLGVSFIQIATGCLFFSYLGYLVLEGTRELFHRRHDRHVNKAGRHEEQDCQK